MSLISRIFGIPLKRYKLSSSVSNYFTIDFVNWIINVFFKKNSDNTSSLVSYNFLKSP